jgi:hypothetical protein
VGDEALEAMDVCDAAADRVHTRQVSSRYRQYTMRVTKRASSHHTDMLRSVPVPFYPDPTMFFIPTLNKTQLLLGHHMDKVQCDVALRIYRRHSPITFDRWKYIHTYTLTHLHTYTHTLHNEVY